MWVPSRRNPLVLIDYALGKVKNGEVYRSSRGLMVRIKPHQNMSLPLLIYTEYWKKRVPSGWEVFCKDEDLSNCSVDNLALRKRMEAGSRVRDTKAIVKKMVSKVVKVKAVNMSTLEVSFFRSIHQASKALELNPGSVSSVLSGATGRAKSKKDGDWYCFEAM